MFVLEGEQSEELRRLGTNYEHAKAKVDQLEREMKNTMAGSSDPALAGAYHIADLEMRAAEQDLERYKSRILDERSRRLIDRRNRKLRGEPG